MNGKTLSIACLTALLSLSGCALFQRTQSDDASLTPSDTEICTEVGCETDPFVNYTQTRADFREEGELSPRDSVVSQSGAGNNLSAAIPPSIESEVISYEEQIENADNQTSDVAENAENIQQETENSSNPQTQQVAENTGLADDGAASVQTTEQAYTSDSSDQDENQTTEQNVQTNDNGVSENATGEEDQEEDEDPVRDWYAEEGQNLKALLTTWSAESGWRLVWNTNRNYVLNAGAMFRGRFADVSSALIRAFARARPAPVATFYKGNRVLVVETMEDENAYD